MFWPEKGYNFTKFALVRFGMGTFNCNLEWALNRSYLFGDSWWVRPKYNNLGSGRDWIWNACPWGLLVHVNFNLLVALLQTPVWFLTNLHTTPQTCHLKVGRMSVDGWLIPGSLPLIYVKHRGKNVNVHFQYFNCIQESLSTDSWTILAPETSFSSSLTSHSHCV